MHQLLRWANKREVARELTRRGFDVSGETLNRWVREEREVPQVVERLVLEMYGITEEAPRPEWAEGLAVDIAGKVIAELTTSRAAEMRRLIDDLEQRLAQRSEAPPVRTDTADQDG